MNVFNFATDEGGDCHECQLLGLEWKAKVEGSQLRLFKAKEGRNMKLSACLNILGSPT